MFYEEDKLKEIAASYTGNMKGRKVYITRDGNVWYDNALQFARNHATKENLLYVFQNGKLSLYDPVAEKQKVREKAKEEHEKNKKAAAPRKTNVKKESKNF